MALKAVGNGNGHTIGGLDHIEVVAHGSVHTFPAQEISLVGSDTHAVEAHRKSSVHIITGDDVFVSGIRIPPALLAGGDGHRITRAWSGE